MTAPVNQQHHEIAMLAAQAASSRCHGTPMSGMGGMGSTGALMPHQAGKAVTDAYAAALASLNPAPVKTPRKTAARKR